MGDKDTDFKFDGKDIVHKNEGYVLADIAKKYKDTETEEIRKSLIEKSYAQLTSLVDEKVGTKKNTETKDMVNPDHYKKMDIESIDLMELKYGTHAVMAFCMLNVEKYMYRADQKGTYELDMEKATWYKDKYVELEEKVLSGNHKRGLTNLMNSYFN